MNEEKKKGKQFRQLETDGKNSPVPIEQYKILFNVIINLNDGVVKGIITIFVIYITICTLVIHGMNTNPNIKNLLFFNYVLIFVFFYYLGYLRFRIKTMFDFARIIENGENFKYRGIDTYERTVRNKFFSTVGLYFMVIGVLMIMNTVLLVVL